MKLGISPAALADLQEAAAYYIANAGSSVGIAFMEEFERASNLILANPQLGKLYKGNRRRYFLRRFPYRVVYQIAMDEIQIVAVAHQRRRPTHGVERR